LAVVGAGTGDRKSGALTTGNSTTIGSEFIYTKAAPIASDNALIRLVKNVISLFVPIVLCFTVVASVAFGILAAYAAVFGILHTFGRSSQPELAHQRPRLILVPTQNHASAD
jgi:hypothetical protein